MVGRTKARSLGRRAELMALLWLTLHGYRLRHRNWRGGGGELDLVMSRGRTLVFIEVKARSSSDFGGAAAAVNAGKQKILLRCAAAYLSRYELWDRPSRFDVLSIEKGEGLLPFSICHIRDAFSADSSVMAS